MNPPRSLKVPGHKRAKVSFGVTVQCECGKTFGPWYGEGASKNAHAEWRWHLGECAKEKETSK